MYLIKYWLHKLLWKSRTVFAFRVSQESKVFKHRMKRCQKMKGFAATSEGSDGVRPVRTSANPFWDFYLPFEPVVNLPSLHCSVVGFSLDWESDKSLRHDRECLTELLERAFLNHVYFRESY